MTQEEKDAIIQQAIDDMVYVTGGTFTMGATSEQDSDALDDEKPTHQVTLWDYRIGKYEVTQELWQAVTGFNPSAFKNDPKNPVERVSLYDCEEFLEELNRLTGKRFRLPTEAEWEYAARGGNKSRGYKYSGSNTLGDVAWYNENSSITTHPVGLKSPNELGLYDMSGNVNEWCQDRYSKYSSDPQTRPLVTYDANSYSIVYRGGSWKGKSSDCRVSRRGSDSRSNDSIIGLRLVL